MYFTLFCYVSWNRKIFGRIISWLALQEDIERPKNPGHISQQEINHRTDSVGNITVDLEKYQR